MVKWLSIPRRARPVPDRLSVPGKDVERLCLVDLHPRRRSKGSSYMAFAHTNKQSIHRIARQAY